MPLSVHGSDTCDAPYVRFVCDTLRRLAAQADEVLSRELTDRTIHERLFGSKIKKPSVKFYTDDPKPQCSVLTSGWSPFVPHSKLQSFGKEHANGLLGFHPYSRPDSLFVYVSVLYFSSQRAMPRLLQGS